MGSVKKQLNVVVLTIELFKGAPSNKGIPSNLKGLTN